MLLGKNTQPSRWNLYWDTVWGSYMLKNVILRNRDVKLVKWKKIRENRICILYAHWVVKSKMLHWLTMGHFVWTPPGTMWWCGGVLCTKNYSPPSVNEEYYTTVPQCKTLHSRMLCWFTYFAVSRVCRRSVFLPSTEYRINIEVECYHSYNKMRMVSLLSLYRHTHRLSDHIHLRRRYILLCNMDW